MEKGIDGLHQAETDFVKELARYHGPRKRARARNSAKVGVFDFHGDGQAEALVLLAPGPDIIGHLQHAGLDLGRRKPVFGKRRFGT